MSSGFLAPVFFVYIGMAFGLKDIPSRDLALAVILIAIVSKIAAGWFGGLLLGMRQREAFGLGLLLNGRGIMELVIASIALEQGLIDNGLFAILVLMGMITTILTPFLIKRLNLQPARS